MATVSSVFGRKLKKAASQSQINDRMIMGKHHYIVADNLLVLGEFKLVLEFANRGLKEFDTYSGRVSFRLFIIDFFRMLAVACYHLNMMTECLDYLNEAGERLGNKYGYFPGMMDIVDDNELMLFTAKTEMGMLREAVAHATNRLSIREVLMDGSVGVELGQAYMAVSDAYLRALDHKSALPFCGKALAIYDKKHPGTGLMEVSEDESLLCVQCYNMADNLFNRRAFKQALGFGKGALTCSSGENLLVVNILCLLGAACSNLKRFDESCGYYNQAILKLLELLKKDEDNDLFLRTLLDIHKKMWIIEDSVGNRDEVVVHARKVSEINEKLLKEVCAELAEGNMAVCEAHLRAFDHDEALPFCLKGLEIYEQLESDSENVAESRRKLAVIYQAKGKYQMSFDFNQLAVSFLQKTRPNSPDLLLAEVEGACTLIGMGRHYEAGDAMTRITKRCGVEGWLRVKYLLTRARARVPGDLWLLATARKDVKDAQEILEGDVIKDPVLCSVGFSDLSLAYSNLDDSDNAMLMMKKALDYPRLPQKLLQRLCEKLMSLISELGKMKRGFPFPYMVDAVESLKEYFGPEHFVVGFGYSDLGVAYLGSGKKEQGLESLVNAKNILDVTLGQHHLTSLKISHSLSVAYATLGRCVEAIEIEDNVVKSLKGMAPREQEFLDEAVKHLSNMKGKETGCPTRASSPSIDTEDLAAKISQVGISEEENQI